ncbi:hypothetical protein AGMMS50276_29970 [Synergistales bacterium]|nr:hypothetical protein AGMMS50276_29970 [Synergistales bacterium]
MDFETFKRAVDSLKGYDGLISTIGGEPLLHPDYSRFAEYLRQVCGRAKLTDVSRGKAIVKDYLAYAKAQRWIEGAANRGRGHLLFTSIPNNYYNYYEDVQDTVSDLWLNDHSSPSFHQPILISRKDLGICDEEFEVLRNRCWLQNFWSGSITPKGTFFCEIAGTLDILFDGPGGKPIEPDWWKRDVSEFSEQFQWCDICGMALKTFSRSANDGIDDASPALYEKLKKMETPKFAKNQVNLVKSIDVARSGCGEIGSDMASAMGNYQPVNEKRLSDAKKNMQPHEIIHVFPAKEESLGVALLREKRNCSNRDWLLYSEPDATLPDNFAALIKERYLNPGYLFICRFDSTRGSSILFSPQSHMIQKMGYDGLRDCNTINDIIAKYGDKTCVLEYGFENLPDIDIPYFRERVFMDYNADETFKSGLKKRLKALAPNGGNIVVLQSAFVFHTLSIGKLVEEMGYDVYIISSSKFKDYLQGWFPEKRLVFFSEESHFNYSAQMNLRNKVKACANFVGSIVPFSFGPSSVKVMDDYTDALRTAEDVGGRILGIINIRRQFIESEYDIWADDIDA